MNYQIYKSIKKSMTQRQFALWLQALDMVSHCDTLRQTAARLAIQKSMGALHNAPCELKRLALRCILQANRKPLRMV